VRVLKRLQGAPEIPPGIDAAPGAPKPLAIGELGGRELEPVVLALGAWGFKALGELRDEQIITPDSMTMDLRTAFRPQVAASLPATSYAARFADTELVIRVDGRALDVARGDGPVDLAFAAGAGIHRLISGELSPERAISSGAVDLLRGRRDLLDRFATTFHLAA
jgi:hypothetical protein